MKRLFVASTNAGKIREVSLALSDLPAWNVEALPELDDIEETGSTFLENARLKAVHYSRALDGLVLADDSGLCVRALDGRPGVHSARYAPTTEARNATLLAELAALGPSADRGAAFYCALAVAHHGEVLWTTETQLSGRIVDSPRGAFGFGYDPLFELPDRGQTLAELPPSEKNHASARGQALRALRAFLLTH